MKKGIIASILILGSAFVFAQNSGPIDLILLLDTSSSMSGSYQQVNNYISGGFLREFLRIGDTFHLLPFSDKPRVDIARRIEGRGDVETVIGRMFLQYPLEPWSDIPGALNFAEQYALSLPSRPKKIVLVSDGDIVPAPGSASRSLDAAGFNALLGEVKTRLAGRGISLDYVRVTPGQSLANLPSSGRAPAAGSGPPQTSAAAQRPPQPQAGGTAAAPPVQSAPPPVRSAPSSQPQGGAPAQSVQTPASASETGISPEAAAQGQGPDFQNKDSGGLDQGQGADVSPFPPIEDEDPAAPPPVQSAPEPERPSVPAAPVETAGSFRTDNLPLPLPALIGLAVLALAALIFIIFLVSRRSRGGSSRAMPSAAFSGPRVREEEPAPFVDHSKDLASYAASQPKQRITPYADRVSSQPVIIDPTGPLLLNLFVEDQNTHIGKRNIHALKSGYSFTIGGGKSDFLIFLVSMPAAIGEVRRDGGRCTFIPRKAKYFPDIGSSQVPDCIGKTIRVVSDKKYELRFRFERYEDPLAVLNRMLNSVKIPG
jgi:hypothetical protein